MTMARILLLAVVLALVPGPAASAQDVVGEAAAALATDPVYVDSSAERALSAAEADRVRQRIESSDAGPVYVAVLPSSAKSAGGGSAQGVAQAIAQRLGRQGTYAVVAGGSFAAGNTNERGYGDLAEAALDARRDEGTSAVLLDFVDRVAQQRAGGSGGSGGGGGGGGGGSGVGTLLLLPLLALGAGAFLLSRRRRGKEREAEIAELRENVRDDLIALGDDIRALDLDVEMPGVDPRAKADYDK